MSTKLLMESWRNYVKLLHEQAGSQNEPTESDKRVANSMGARVRGADEVADAGADQAYRTIGFLVSWQIANPANTEKANQGISELQQYMKNTQMKLGPVSQKAYDIVGTLNQNEKEYYFNISKQFQSGGIKAAQAYIQKYSGQDQQSAAPKPPQETAAQGKEVAGNEIGSKTNPASSPDQVANIKARYPKGTVYYFRINGQVTARTL